MVFGGAGCSGGFLGFLPAMAFDRDLFAFFCERKKKRKKGESGREGKDEEPGSRGSVL
jgi:hypothetical protein